MNKELKNEQLAAENEHLRQKIAELSKFKHERKDASKKKTLDQISTPAHISEFMRDLAKENKKDFSLRCSDRYFLRSRLFANSLKR